jgi:hypothetical protein
MASLFYMGVILAMAYDLSHDQARAIKIGEDLQESEHRLEMAAEAAQLGVWIRDLATDRFGPRTGGVRCLVSRARNWWISIFFCNECTLTTAMISVVFSLKLGKGRVTKGSIE